MAAETLALKPRYGDEKPIEPIGGTVTAVAVACPNANDVVPLPMISVSVESRFFTANALMR